MDVQLPVGNRDRGARERLARAHDDGVATRIRPQRVKRPRGRGNPEPAPLSRREAPEPVVPADLPALEIEDGPVPRLEAVATEERAVVVAREEAGLLTLCAIGHRKPGAPSLGPGLLLRPLSERKPDAGQLGGIDTPEHVGLILLAVERTAHEHAPAALDDARVVTGDQAPCTQPCTRGKESGEAQVSVATGAGVRRLAPRVALDERPDDRGSERVAQIQRDVRNAPGVTELAGHADRRRGTAGTVGIRALRIDPEAKRYAHRFQAGLLGLEQRDGAVHPAAHRDGNAALAGSCTSSRPDRGGKCVGGESRRRHRGRREQGQALYLLDERAHAGTLPAASTIRPSSDTSRRTQTQSSPSPASP